MIVAEHAGLGENAERALRPLDVELVARRAAEGLRGVGADLRRDAELGQERERAAHGRRRREVEVERDGAAATEMHRSGGVEQRRDLRQPVAASRRCDRSQLRPDVVDERRRAHRCTPSSASSRRFSPRPAEPYPPMPFAATMRWHGMMSEKRLSAQNEPAARAAPGRPARTASSP